MQDLEDAKVNTKEAIPVGVSPVVRSDGSVAGRGGSGIESNASSEQILLRRLSGCAFGRGRAHCVAILGSWMIGTERLRPAVPPDPSRDPCKDRSSRPPDRRVAIGGVVAALLQGVDLNVHSAGEVGHRRVIGPGDPGGGQQGLVERQQRRGLQRIGSVMDLTLEEIAVCLRVEEIAPPPGSVRAYPPARSGQRRWEWRG